MLHVTDVCGRTQDLWNIGKVIGLGGFDDSNDAELDVMNKSLARAKRDDKKEMRSMDEEVLNQQMEQYMGGEGEPEGQEERSKYVSAKWMEKIRAKYEGAVIRRTTHSTDYRGDWITGLEAYEQHLCVVKMYDHEYEALEKLAEKAADSETFVRRFASEVSERMGLVFWRGERAECLVGCRIFTSTSGRRCCTRGAWKQRRNSKRRLRSTI
jgi:hypothetical protein